MNQLINKSNLGVSIANFLAGVVIILGAMFLFAAGQIAQIAVAVIGLLTIIVSVLIFFSENKIVKYALPGLYVLAGATNLVALILDINKGLFGFGFVAEVVAAILFFAFAFIAISKTLGVNNFWLHAVEVLLCFAMGACIFFALFSNASFGYKFTKMNTTESLQIFYMILIFGGYTILAISNYLYPNLEDSKKRK